VKRALITGCNGQDGAILTELLLSKDYEVWGFMRRSSTTTTGRIAHLLSNPLLHIVHGDMADTMSLFRAMRQAQPDEVYNLAAQSQVMVSFQAPEYTSAVTATGAVRLLDIIRTDFPNTRFYQASSSEMFGKVMETPQTENTPFNPRSPYAVAKMHAHYAAKNYREAYGLFATCGILYNHESKTRSEDFVTRKITRAATRINLGLQGKLKLGNLDAKRDWGYAGDFVRGMHMMMQVDAPGDFILATGEAHSVREFVQLAFENVGLEWSPYVDHDPAMVRPSEVDILLGDATKARQMLGWTPTVTFEQLVRLMIDADMKLAQAELDGRLIR